MIYIYIKGIFPPFKPLATVSNPISSDQNNSLVLALPRVSAVNTIDRRIIHQSTLVPTKTTLCTHRYLLPKILIFEFLLIGWLGYETKVVPYFSLQNML